MKTNGAKTKMSKRAAKEYRRAMRELAKAGVKVRSFRSDAVGGEVLCFDFGGVR